MTVEEGFLIALFITVLFAVLGIGAWISDEWLERKKPRVPPPQRRAVVGESHKPWM